MIHVADLRFDYGRPAEFQLRIDELTLDPRQRVAVIGPSGSGKTSLAYLLAGILVPQAGEIHMEDFRVSAADDAARRAFRARRIGFVFQEFELIEYLPVRENILLPYVIRRSSEGASEAERRCRLLAERVGILDKLRRFPNALSQGEKQRVAICRALVTQPALLIGDEPTGDLDPENAANIMDILLETTLATGAGLLLITHDHSQLGRFDRVINMADFLGRKQR